MPIEFDDHDADKVSTSTLSTSLPPSADRKPYVMLGQRFCLLHGSCCICKCMFSPKLLHRSDQFSLRRVVLSKEFLEEIIANHRKIPQSLPAGCIRKPTMLRLPASQQPNLGLKTTIKMLEVESVSCLSIEIAMVISFFQTFSVFIRVPRSRLHNSLVAFSHRILTRTSLSHAISTSLTNSVPTIQSLLSFFVCSPISSSS